MMHLIITNNNTYGLGVGTLKDFDILRQVLFQGGRDFQRVLQTRLRHLLIIKNGYVLLRFR